MTRYALLALALSLTALPAVANAASFWDDELAGGPVRERREAQATDAIQIEDQHPSVGLEFVDPDSAPPTSPVSSEDEVPAAPSARGVPERRLTWAGRDRS